ncbi:hypothetical protein ACIGCK_09515 [Microbacterium sp. NPDC078428]|uniref:SDH family Clp fold serine proteinase n=1 Tax=Microbacterium sp. NPDC078428 TaxID=3364190 RepID=UPI0037C59862
MSTWNALVDESNAVEGAEKDAWINDKLSECVRAVSEAREGRNVLVYFSAFLQKPAVPATHTMMMPEDINGFMAAFHGMDWDKGLSVVMHTPGGATMAVQSLVDYTRSKFRDVELLVPAYSMSAGTMFGLACERIYLGRQSQLGPIDPQLTINGRQQSARSIVEQFERAHDEILGNSKKKQSPNPAAAAVWAPLLGSLGPSLLQTAQDQLDFSESMVARWLASYMFANERDAAKRGKKVAKYFNDASSHKSHDKRISYDEARKQGVVAVRLEDDQGLQEAVLTLYHLLTIIVGQTSVTKLISANSGVVWAKNWTGTT